MRFSFRRFMYTSLAAFGLAACSGATAPTAESESELSASAAPFVGNFELRGGDRRDLSSLMLAADGTYRASVNPTAQRPLPWIPEIYNTVQESGTWEASSLRGSSEIRLSPEGYSTRRYVAKGGVGNEPLVLTSSAGVTFNLYRFVDTGQAPGQAWPGTFSLARANGCMNCHNVDTAMAGPSFEDIARRYKDVPDAVDMLTNSIKSGSKGKWVPRPLPMPPNNRVTDADARRLAQGILAYPIP